MWEQLECGNAALALCKVATVQPAAWIVRPAICSGLIPSARSFTGSGSHGALQFGQRSRMRRWAITARTAVDTRNGFTPTSTRRTNELGASLV